ncbi:bifunctional DNA primase/polymerase [Bradyrhizobium sp. 156]|uniref:bifunctional DNA primase/polymerase n=1 Tax=Bradyrhizobium sp. 156 TaxID=2782630 RepID=UPI001FFC0ED9|nr:bifunctional DNA primase/polymerase [Bradyrhizobium sp. 156]MCK1322757.1 bifunctional DNA primase/polymerase [Bradyrhizobium sp. 156]
MSSALRSIVHLWRGLAGLGYWVVPCTGKAAVVKNWQRSRWSAEQMAGIARNYPDATNTGLLCGELVGLDIDTPHAETADAIRAMVMDLPGANRAPFRVGKAPKILFAFRATKPREKRATGAYLINGHKCQVEALGERTQFVAFGTHPETGRSYEWNNGSPAETTLADLPEISPEAIDGLLARAEEYFAARGTPIKPASRSASNRHTVKGDSDHPWADINSRALASPDAWVPDLGLDGLRRYQRGFHAVASFRPSINSKVKKRGRALNIQPSGIVDYSDGNQGYSPIDLVAVCLSMPAPEASEWLRERVGGGDDTKPVCVAGLVSQPARRRVANSKSHTY